MSCSLEKYDVSEQQKELFEKYSSLLLLWNEKMNLTAITDPDEINLKHFADSISCRGLINHGAKLIDVGTGAGFPGLPLKIVRPDIRLTLLDALNKRVDFLNEVIESLGLCNVETIHSRAEDAARNSDMREKFDVAVSRAVAPLPVLCEYCLPFVKVGGIFIAYKGKDAAAEAASAENASSVMGGKIAEIKETFSEDLEHYVIIIEKTGSTPSKYPRKAGKPTKQPIL